MSSSNRHPVDEVIDRELEGLRRTIPSKHGLGDAVRAMQSPPPALRPSALRWPIGIGSAIVATCAVILAGRLMTGNAYAAELHDVATAQLRQKTMHEKSYLYGDSGQVVLVLEVWIDHEKEAIRQFGPKGDLEVATVSDGKRTFHYTSAALTGSGKPYGSVDRDRSSRFGITTIESVLNSPFFRNRKIAKTAGVKLNGRRCDYYDLAHGYYRLWVDPITKLPLQRDISDRGVTLWKRSVYDYPASFPEATFEPFHMKGLVYVDIGGRPNPELGMPERTTRGTTTSGRSKAEAR